ncbi:MAG: 50S ribosomal protein L18 [Candidatus Margulisiibacteriota bacterium]|nr:MAG: 50S ribosomal protein L18 [Candidatus Margulisbacteria bacterium GWD2_39_127]PZM79785.1 MAG: 50S ribosomal protein L18 [Candidatus Margulisiibacteriota bacterium]HAR62692.1 50S ribosomal protein L18 [Candidatus Margulisiibacteriota bacterium]HCY36813.1 50S ribosomal protein L18 [Candidatus Margulisiibacteriota bacterium]
MVYKKKKSLRAKNIFGSSEKPRLCVYRGVKNIGAQIVDDEKGITLASASTNEKDLNKYQSNIEGAEKIGIALAERAVKAGVTKVIFDRRDYIYHGKIKALADAARKGGLDF